MITVELAKRLVFERCISLGDGQDITKYESEELRALAEELYQCQVKTAELHEKLRNMK